jgi:hypothetical protein
MEWSLNDGGVLAWFGKFTGAGRAQIMLYATTGDEDRRVGQFSMAPARPGT